MSNRKGNSQDQIGRMLQNSIRMNQKLADEYRKMREVNETLLKRVHQLALLTQRMVHQNDATHNLLVDGILEECFNGKNKNDEFINSYSFKVFSQYGEDGIIKEIFRRIGTSNKYFVEFGVGNGFENNTLHLLSRGWHGTWLESNCEYVNHIQKHFSDCLDDGSLDVKKSFVNRENIESLFGQLDVPSKPDLISIDINGNDYWVWKALREYEPRVVVIEYNAIHPPDTEFVKPYDPSFSWDGTSDFGASLKSMELLGRKKGYSLIGCSTAGVNAFFVRQDLADSHFDGPFTAERLYEPPRYYLKRNNGHPRSWS